MLIHVYDRSAGAGAIAAKATTARAPRMNGRAHVDDRQLRDAEEFELDGLVSDDEDEEQAARRKLLKEDTAEESGLASPSTLGRNSDRVAP